MNNRIKDLQDAIEPVRQQIINHKVYTAIKSLEDLKIFMEYHVYAVWDFMSLLKSLQNGLTCTSVPWFPKGSADTRHLINEIVVGEESDVDEHGRRISHFELYLEAMKQCGADTSKIEAFIAHLEKNNNLKEAFHFARVPAEAQQFVQFTFDTIESSKDYLQAAVFTFGREDLIPAMFLSIIKEIHNDFPEEVSIFKYYIERHIEVDGDHHSNLALQMTEHLCGDDELNWREAQAMSVKSLEHRIGLWNGIYKRLIEKEEPVSGA
ncbi:DUF3050 domain-containing protein [Niabella sp. W65]|nr:DUF3050 domain-containing protein [Niabella sp. W65]MCH7363580.1 DUF3050 domain-containing protein [Niabella sp. W65]ULT39494.1 DUF3050 domain-containing protein [Niabella sp. I65]